MKPLSVIYAIVLGLSASVQAQDKTTDPNGPSKRTTPAGQLRNVPDPAVASGGTDTPASSSSASINMELSGGRLVDAIAEIENHVSGGGPGAQPTPNMIYSSEDVREIAMPGKFRLTGVTPVQAIALACAAAGCALDPIYAPAEGTSSSEAVQKVIGYRVVRGSAQNPLPTASKSTTFTGPGRVDLINQNIAATTAKVIDLRARYAADHPNVIAGEMELVKLQRALEQSTAESKRRAGSISPTQGAGGASKLGQQRLLETQMGGFGMSSHRLTPSADTTERVVSVYPLGSLLGRSGENGSVETPETQKRRDQLIRATEELISQTLAQAELNAAKSPDLAFNDSLRVLVAKANAAQHEIISQIIQALKENETVPAQANQGFPTAEPILPTPTSSLSSPEKPKSNP